MKQAEKQPENLNMSRKEKYSTARSSADPLIKVGDDEMILYSADNKPADRYRVPLIKRFSPFLILFCLLLVLFPYMMITGTGSVKNFWVLLFLFPFTEVNLFYADFAIWRYFSGKKIMPIWIIELSFSILIVKLLI